jgi:hypothetical protein
VKTTVVVYANSDDVLLLWSADELDPQLEGFSIQRKLKRAGKAEQTSWLENYAPPGVKAYQDGSHVPSDQRPVRAFSWTDHTASAGDRVRYRIAPFLAGTTAPTVGLASGWSGWKTIGPPRGATYQAFFNRGFVISQFVSRYLDATYPGLDRLAALAKLKDEISSKLDSTIRTFLAGDLRSELLALLDPRRRHRPVDGQQGRLLR